MRISSARPALATPPRAFLPAMPGASGFGRVDRVALVFIE
jgi:hypothetical protein